MNTKIPAVIMRGGTSKAVFLHHETLPQQAERREAVILSIFGSPDKRQIDGLGGADPLTSKVAIVGRSSRPDADIDYTFGQVGIDRATVNCTLSCGNTASAVGPFAIDEGLLPVSEPVTQVRIHDTNSGKIILADVPVANGKACTEGDCVIDGAPGSGAGIRLTFVDPAGAVTGRLLPTGQARDQFSLSSGPTEVSFVDSGTLYAFIPAGSLGLSGHEDTDTIERTPGVMEEVDAFRKTATERLVRCGAVSQSIGSKLACSLKVAVVGKSETEDTDLCARILNPGKVHKAFAVTGAIALGSAASVPGSIIGDLLPTRRGGPVAIAHPSGRIVININLKSDAEQLTISGATIMRTARRIMEGFVYLHSHTA